jgi:ABC-type multidrug transport system fused ATPase/permease subunit
MKKFLRKNIIISTLIDINNTLLPKHKKKVILMVFLILVSGVLDVLGLAAILPVSTLVFAPETIHQNHLVASVYNGLGFSNETYFLYFILVCFLFIIIIKNAATALISYAQSKFSFGVASDLSKKQFDYVMSNDLQYFNDFNSTALVRNIQIIPFHFSTYLLLPMLILSSEIVVVLIVIIAISWYNITVVSMIALTLAPAFPVTYKLIKSRTQFYEKQRDKLNVELTKHAYQTIFGYIDVKLFNKDRFFINQFRKKQTSYNKVVTNAFTLNLIPSKIIEITAISGVIIMFAYTLYSPEARASISVMLPIFLAAAYRIMPSMNRMLIALGSIKGYQYVLEVLRPSRDYVSPESHVDLKEEVVFNHEIAFKNLAYKYPSGNRLSIDHVSLTIKKGQKIGIVGKSGSGKTTMINVLLRFLKEQEGGIYVDGLKITPELESQWRNLIGYVKQNVFIIDGDFYENIAFGVNREDVDLVKLDRAITLSKLDEVVAKSPKGLASNIGENGTKLSGGQRQRIAIARALYKDAQILVFDEATSALDSQTEREITESIASISSENKTMFIVAHRITTLENCDVIYNMEDGKIVSTHTYAELAKTMLVE